MAELEIGSLTFEVEDSYKEGDSLSEAEANALNGLRRENLRNNFRKTVKEAGDSPNETKVAELRAAFAEYEGSYEFAGKRRAKAPKDPVAARAHQMATSVVKAALRKKEIEVTDEKLAELVAQYAARADVIALARQQVELTRSIAEEAMDAA